MTTSEMQNPLILNVSLSDAAEPAGFREAVPAGIETGGGMPEIEEKIQTNSDPRTDVAEWTGLPGEVEVYAPWAERTERWVMFVPRPDAAGKFNKISFIRDLSRPDEPVQLRRKLAIGEQDTHGGPLTRREIYNDESELPEVIQASGGSPDQTYPMSPHAIRDRVERLVLDVATGNVLSITGDYCYPVDTSDESGTDSLYQCEVEFKGVAGDNSPTIEGVMESVVRVSQLFGTYLSERGLDPQPTDVSKSKWLEEMTRERGIIQ